MLNPVRLIGAMCVAEVLGMLGFSTFPALLPRLMSEWNLSNTDAGWINAIFFAGYLTAVILLVSLTDRVDPRRIYLLCMAFSGLASLGFSLLAQGFWTALLLRTLAGIGLAGTYMPGLKALTDHIEGAAQSRAVSFYTASFGVGTSLSFYLSGKIAAWQGWRMAFGIAALGPPLAIGLAWLVLPAQQLVTASSARVLWRDFYKVFRNRWAMGYTLAYACHNFELFGFRSWIVAFLTFSLQFQAGDAPPLSPPTLAAIVMLLSLPSSVIGNEMAVRFGRRRVVVIVMLTSALLAGTL
ncbi:MAG: MFS transporter, partial [Nitrospinota bacterium]